jgi:hypothetical protein
MRAFARLLVFPALLAVLPAAAAGQTLADYDYENLTFRGFGFDYGYIWPDKVEAAPMWSVRLDLGFLGPAVRLTPALSYWSSRFRAGELDRLADRISELPALRERGVSLTAADLGDIHWSDLALGLDAHVVWTAPFDVITFLGVGASLHALNGRGDAIADTFIEDLLDSTAAGAALMAGFELQPLARLRVYAESRYTLTSNVRYPSLRVGASLMLPPRQQHTVQGVR